MSCFYKICFKIFNNRGIVVSEYKSYWNQTKDLWIFKFGWFKSKSKNIIAYAEILLDESFNINYSDNNINIVSDLNFKYTPISEYPSSTRDLSFSITEFSKSDELQEYLLNFKDNLLKDVFIFDYFYNEKKMEIKIGFRFIFQDNKSTITETKVNDINKFRKYFYSA